MAYNWLEYLPFTLTDWGVDWEGYGDWETQAAAYPGTVNYTPEGVLNHHTASTNWYPKHKLTTKCNLYIDPAGKVWIMSLGYQADSGMGDPNVLMRVRNDQPISRPLDFTVASRINGNPWFIDIEVGHPGDGTPIPTVQRDALVQCNAAICDMMGWDPATRVLGHKEWTRRKIDPRWWFRGGIDEMEDIRNDTVVVLEEGGLMPRVLFEKMIRALFAADGEFQGDPNYWIDLIDTPDNVEWDDFFRAFTRMVS